LLLKHYVESDLGNRRMVRSLSLSIVVGLLVGCANNAARSTEENPMYSEPAPPPPPSKRVIDMQAFEAQCRSKCCGGEPSVSLHIVPRTKVVIEPVCGCKTVKCK
jgi:hypothetical protein